MKLIGPAMTAQFRRDLVDSLRHDQHRPVGCLRQEIAQRPIQAPRQNHSLAVLRDERERAIDREYDGGIRGEQSAASGSKITGPEVL